MGLFNRVSGGLMKAVGAKLRALRKTDGTQTSGTISTTGGSGVFGKIVKAANVAKMNGDTSAPASNPWKDGSFKKIKRNNIFGN